MGANISLEANINTMQIWLFLVKHKVEALVALFPQVCLLIPLQTHSHFFDLYARMIPLELVFVSSNEWHLPGVRAYEVLDPCVICLVLLVLKPVDVTAILDEQTIVVW